MHNMAVSLCQQVVEELQTFLGVDPEEATESQAEAVISAITLVAAYLEAYLIGALPEDRACNVRATLEHMSRTFATQKVRELRAFTPKIINNPNTQEN